MKKVLVILGLTLAAPCIAAAQSLQVIEAEILEYIECVKQLSRPDYHNNEYVLSGGKRVRVMEQTDFDRFAFSSIDSFIDNMDRVFDESLFFNPMRRMLMDGVDLSRWERDSFKQISEEYFRSGGNCSHIASHGIAGSGETPGSILMGGQQLNAEETAELILKTMEDVGPAILNAGHKPFTVVLHSCGLGKGENSFAAALSRALAREFDNVAVVAAPDLVCCTLDEDGRYSERVASAQDIRSGKYAERGQSWLVFKDGKKVMTGTKDYAGTVEMYNSSIQRK